MALFEKKSKILQSIGETRAALSREKTPVREAVFGKSSSNARKLSLGKAAAGSLIKAAQERARENQSTDSNN